MEEEMTQNDSSEKLIDEAKNDLEAQIYKIGNLIERNFYDYVDPSIVDEVKSKVTSIQLWYEENEFDRMKLEDYANRSNELKKLTSPISKRMDNYENSILGVKTVENRILQLNEKYGNERDPRIVKIMAHVKNFMVKLKDVKEQLKYKDVPFSVEKNKSAIEVLAKNLESIKNNQKFY